jgi:hypothetical protein
MMVTELVELYHSVASLFFFCKFPGVFLLPRETMQAEGGLHSVKVKGLPRHLSHAAIHELGSHYGAIRSRPLTGPMVAPPFFLL